MSEPLVSIIIPCYNYGRYLRESVDSALGQTYPNLEVIVVNDGSSDDSEEIAKSYGKKVNYSFQPNSGLVSALNHGLSLASGEFILVLSADDSASPEMVRKLVDALVDAPRKVAVSYCDIQFFATKNTVAKSKRWSSRRMLASNFIPASSMVRREAIEKAGGYSNYLGRYPYEDWDLWIKLVRLGYSGIHTPGAYIHYRLHGGGADITNRQHHWDNWKLIRSHNQDAYRSWVVRIYVFVLTSYLRCRGMARRLLMSVTHPS